MEHYPVELYGRTDARTLVVVIFGHGERSAVWEAFTKLGETNVALAMVSVADWNRDLSPWPAPSAFKRAEAFAGEADAFLAALTDEVLSGIVARLASPPEWVVLAGYSLAGLFATYTACNSDAFDAIVSASGSLWYPGFVDYVRAHVPRPRMAHAYFSVGDREAATKNKPLQSVEANTRAVSKLFANCGVQTIFELNKGGHFQDMALRLARGICWAVGCCASIQDAPGGA